MKPFNTVLFASLLLAPALSAASAADLTPPMEQPVAVETSGAGFYLGSLNSATFLDDTSFDLGGGAAGVDTDYDVGYYSAVRAGYNFGSMGFFGPRVELELGYGNSSVDSHSVNGVGVASVDSFGDARTLQAYVNGYLDIPLVAPGSGMFSAITPYLGGGAGVMNLELRRQGISAIGTAIDDDDTQFSYHLDAGVGINLQELGLFNNISLFSNTTLDIGYRYTAADDFRFEARDGTSSKTDFSSNAVTFGFRKQF